MKSTKKVTKVHHLHNILPIYSNKSMGFALKKVWVIGYQRVMGYGFEILDRKSYELWESMGYQGYGLRGCQL
ncbi:hypothetical protein L208DRAFT_1556233 [Tricholoma matsutake]|nr:hypothetical protein L208DRAFT_1556233 [Tricholoma matsutake 945]